MKENVTMCIIDDDEIYQFTLTRNTEIQEVADKVLTFYNGKEAMEFLIEHANSKEELPDVIFLDINMPIMDGWQFLDEYVGLKPKIGKAITLYMVSSSVDNVDIERAKNISEVSDYLIKPIMPGQFKEIVKALKAA